MNPILEKVYLNSPIFFQNLMCSVYGKKAKNLRFSDFYESKFNFLLESEWWDINRIEEYKNEQFLKLINYSYNNTRYYKNVIDEHGYSISDFKTIDDLEKLPILTKEDVRENFTDIISLSYPSNEMIENKTSGSSGKALSFYLSPEAIQFQWAVWMRFRKRFNINLYDKSCNFTGKLVVPIHQKHPPFWRLNKPMNQFVVNMQHIKKENIKHIVDFINNEKFVFFSGYPSIIYNLSLLIESEGYKIVYPPKCILTGAETLFVNQRKKISEVFNCNVVDQYGFSECVANASRCKYDNFHEDFEFGHFELLNKEKLNEKESRGDLLATGFSNYAMPFLRYKVGDSAILNNDSCECGRKSMTLKSIDGRLEDFVITPEGTKIMRFDYLFKDQKEIKECQVIQNKLGEIIFKIVKRDHFNLNHEKLLIADVRKWISPTISIKIEFVQEIEKTLTGKFKAVVSNIKRD